MRSCAELCQGLKNEMIDKVKVDDAALSRIATKAYNQEVGAEEHPNEK